MELQVLLSDMARIMELPPHSSFGDAQDTPPSPPQHHPPLQHQHQQHQSQQHQPQHQGTSLPLAQHLQLHAQHQAQQVQSSMLALLGTAAAAAAAHPDGAAHPGHTGAAAALAVWPGASPSQRPQLSPASGGSDAGDVLAGAADDSASDLFWSHGASSSSPPRDGGGSRLPPRASPRPAAAAARPAPRRPRRPRAARTEAALSKEGARRPESAAWEAVRGGALPRRHPPRPRPRARHHRRRPGRPPLDGEAAAAARRRRQEGAQGRSEALLALPSLTVFKQEAPSPSNGDNGRDEGDGGGASGGAGMASQLQQLLQQHAAAAAAAAAAGAAARGGGGGAGAIFHPAAAAAMHGAGLDAHAGMVNSGECFSQHMGASATNSPASSNSCPSAGNQEPGVDCRFQYVLAAATSIATKVNEETLTYLNQGQSYEIKLKKLGELSAYRGKILKSTIRVCFHERRLQYTEREQMAAWQASRPGDRVVEVDVPLSYGLLDIIQDPMQLNAVEFLWDPTKEVGVYIKVNCISTEFTPKKHGGEKGVPFRIQVETYLQGDGGLKRLHAAACQVKVFKLKGADRKHKQDREKILKRPLSEQEKYQPSYECTVLSDIPSDALMLPQPVTPVVTSSISTGPVYSPTDAVSAPGRPNAPLAAAAAGLLPPKEERASLLSLPSGTNGGTNSGVPGAGLTGDTASSLQPAIGPISPGDPLPREASAAQAARWLEAQRFTAHLRTFGSIAPSLTLYLCVEEQSPVYRALYLHSLSYAEFVGKLANLVGVPVSQLSDVLLQGPAGIHVLLTDDVIRNVRNETRFMLEVLPDTNHDQYRLLLKPTQ
ncbi:Transcription factor CP2 [Gryllus bimaculatus]|nr:Transcription factor CP2 [Gryllus bimaculatus]